MKQTRDLTRTEYILFKRCRDAMDPPELLCKCARPLKYENTQGMAQTNDWCVGCGRPRVFKSGQSHLGSITEATVNMVVGFGVAFLTQLVVYPWFGIHVTVDRILALQVIFMGVSIIRSYTIRRAFNRYGK